MLTGNLRTMGLPEILQWISIGRKTGTLMLQHGSIEKKISFLDGDIHSSWSNDPRESLGQYLVRSRRVSEEQLFKALLRQEELQRPLGTILVADAVLDEEALREALRTKAEESIYDLFLWREGHFEFKDGGLPSDVAVHLDLRVQSVLLEGIRRLDEWERIRSVFPSRRTTFRVDTAADPGNDYAVRLAALDAVTLRAVLGDLLSRAGVEPQDGGTHRVVRLVHAHERLALVGDAYRPDAARIHHLSGPPEGGLGRLPPVFGVLLAPVGPRAGEGEGVASLGDGVAPPVPDHGLRRRRRAVYPDHVVLTRHVFPFPTGVRESRRPSPTAAEDP